jgi:hypothetical protein
MLNIKVFLAFVLVTSIGFTTTALAGFGLPSIPGVGGGQDDSAQNYEATAQRQDKLTQQYKKAQNEIFTAQKLISEAFGLDEQAALLDAERQAFSSGALTKDQLDKATELTRNTQEMIDKKIAGGEQLTEEGRAKYQKSLLPFANGLLQTSLLVPEFKNLLTSAQAQISSAPITKKLEVTNRLGVGVAVATKLPGHIERLATATTGVLTYAKSQNLDTAPAVEVMSLVPDMPAIGEPGTAGIAAPAQSAAASPPPAKRSTRPASQRSVQPTAQQTARGTESASATDWTFRAQLASSRSEENIWNDWSTYQARYADIFGDLDAQVQRAEVGAKKIVWYRLQVGPFASRSSASELCTKIAERGVGAGCMPVRVSR